MKSANNQHHLETVLGMAKDNNYKKSLPSEDFLFYDHDSISTHWFVLKTFT